MAIFIYYVGCAVFGLLMGRVSHSLGLHPLPSCLFSGLSCILCGEILHRYGVL